MKYIATFYTHFAAMAFSREIASRGIEGQMMPVPRRLSASCGTCVAFETDGDISPLLVEDTEEVFRVDGDDYASVMRLH